MCPGPGSREQVQEGRFSCLSALGPAGSSERPYLQAQSPDGVASRETDAPRNRRRGGRGQRVCVSACVSRCGCLCLRRGSRGGHSEASLQLRGCRERAVSPSPGPGCGAGAPGCEGPAGHWGSVCPRHWPLYLLGPAPTDGS